jgi:PKD repeat protein
VTVSAFASPHPGSVICHTPYTTIAGTNFVLPIGYDLKALTTTPENGSTANSGYNRTGTYDSTVLINVPAAPCTLTAKFSINSSVQCITNNKFVFTDLTTGGTGALSYYWDFNDGTSSTEQNPVHVYGKPSDHDISLTVKDSSGCSSGYLLQITVGPVPNLGFTVTPNTVDGHYFTFNNTSSVAAGWLNYSWNFGDNTGSTLVTPSKSYTAPGIYNVTLNVAASGGCKDSLTQILNTETGVMSSCTPKVGEITGTLTLCSGSSIQLSDTTANGVWSSSDATLAKVSAGGLVTGLSAGSATISYGVSNSCGTTTQTAVVTVEGAPVVNNIVASVNTISVGSTIQLANGTPNGVWSSLNNSVATISATGLVTGISAGVDTLSYRVSNSCGTTRVTSPITVSDLPPISGPTSLCKGTSITLSEAVAGGTWSTSNDNIASVVAITADSTQAKVTGVLNGAGGTVFINYTLGSSSVLYAVTVNGIPAKPVITGPDSVVTGSTIQLTSSIPNGLWSSSDTSVATVNVNGVVTGIKTGADTLSYIVSNACGSDSAMHVIICKAPSPACTLTAKFSINSLVQCITDNKFVFTDLTTGGNGALSYYWDFNDGTSSTEQNPVHVYGKPSDHDIALTVKDSYGCSSGYLLQITVGPVPNLGFTVTPNTVDGHYFTFNNTSSVAAGWLNYSWNFGDNTGSTLVTPSKLYAAPGIYNVTLNVAASGGCKDSLTQILNTETGVMSSCTPKVGEITGTLTLCSGSSIQLSDTTANGVWSSSDATLAKVSAGGLVTGLSAGSATISYGVSNSCGTANQTAIVTIESTSTVNNIIAGVTTVSVGSTIQLTNDTPNGLWSSFNTSVATVNTNGIVTGVSAGVDTLSYMVSNSCGGSVDVLYVITCTETPPPVCRLTAKFSINSLVQCITDNKFVFTDLTTGGTGALTYYWDFNDSTSSTEQNPVHVYGKPSDHDISLTVKDSYGCSSGYLLQITVGPVPSAGFTITPNTVDGQYYTFNNTSSVASGWLNYIWDFGDGSGSTLVSPSKLYSLAGTYHVKLITSASGGCMDSVTQTLTVNNIFKVSNNPTSTTSTVTYLPNSNSSTICIINEATGKLVKVQKVGTVAGNLTNTKIDLSKLSSGTYVIVIENSNGAVIGKTSVIKL